MRFKGLLNISVAAAGLRRLLCRFCVFPLPVGAIPVVGSGWGLIPSGRAEASSAGGQGARGRDQRAGGWGVAEKQGVSLARGIGLYTRIPSHPLRNFTGSTSAGSYANAPSGGAEKGGGGFYVRYYENN